MADIAAGSIVQAASPAPSATIATRRLDPAAAARRRDARLRIIVPIIVALATIGAWEAWVRLAEIPHYIVPAPSRIAVTLVSQWQDLGLALLYTLKITVLSLLLAIIGGVVLASLFAMSPWVELALFPYAVILQVTPIVAIAPLILIWAPSTTAALLICAWIVAFFPILSNTVIGLKSADQNLRDLFQLYGAGRWQRLRYLLAPSALPFFMAGLKIAGGLSLIGAVVAEFTAGAAGRETGLASRILEASFRTEIPRMFAALVLVSALGVAIFVLFDRLSKLVLGKWHESELRRDF